MSALRDRFDRIGSYETASSEVNRSRVMNSHFREFSIS
jgi:hypothetical protein